MTLVDEFLYSLRLNIESAPEEIHHYGYGITTKNDSQRRARDSIHRSSLSAPNKSIVGGLFRRAKRHAKRKLQSRALSKRETFFHGVDVVVGTSSDGVRHKAPKRRESLP